MNRLSIGKKGKTPFVSRDVWRSTFNTVAKKAKGRCYYCKSKYSKLDTVVLGNNVDETSMLLCCKVCKMIKECSYKNQKDLVLCWSKVSQVDIVSETTKYVRKYNKIPKITEIDPEAKQLNLSLIEFIELVAGTNIPKQMYMYKVFISSYFDKSVITESNDNQSMFIDDEECNDLENTEEELIEQDESDEYGYYLQKKDDDEDLPLYNFSSKEKKVLDAFFKPHNTNEKDMMCFIIDNIRKQFIDDSEFSEVDDKYYNVLMTSWLMG